MFNVLAPEGLGQAFRWLIASSWVSNLGDGFTLSARPLLVASDTRNPTLFALATLLQRTPWLVFAIVAGAIADRRNRVAIVVAVGSGRAGLLVLLATFVITGAANITLVLVAMFLVWLCRVRSSRGCALASVRKHRSSQLAIPPRLTSNVVSHADAQ